MKTLVKRKISIVIVNFNGGDFLIRCLKSLQNVKDEADLSIFVVDNVSSDGSFLKAKKLFPKLKYIQNKENIGFGAGNNVALKLVKDENILLFNPDNEIKEGVLTTMLDFMDQNPDVGVSTCKIVLENGLVDLTAHRGFPTPWASLLYFLGEDSLYHLSKRDLNSIHEVDAISGAFFLTRKSVLEKVGLFDEDYFMYAEDIDLCYRIKQAGFKVMYVPTVEILHHKGVSSGLKKHSQNVTTASLQTRRRSLNAFYQTMKIFYQKHMDQKYPFFINWIVYLGINVKWWLAKRSMNV